MKVKKFIIVFGILGFFSLILLGLNYLYSILTSGVGGVANVMLGMCFLMLYVTIILFMVGFIFKLIKELRYNIDPFKVFKKQEKVSNNEIIINMVKKIDTHQYIIPVKDGVVLVNGNGINVIMIFNGEGTLSNKNNIWTFNNKPIDLFKTMGDNNYLIRYYRVNYDVTGIDILNMSELLFKLEKELIMPKYTNEQIDELYEKVKYGYNQN